MAIRVVTDSASDLPKDIAAAHDVTVVPLTIRFGAEELIDQVDLTTDEFWRRCRASRQLPETAAPSPGAFQAAYEAAADDGCDGVLCITLSSNLSATFQSAHAAVEPVAGRIPVRVIDSTTATMGVGLLAIAAAGEAASGDLDRMAAATEERITRSRLLGVVATLDHLQRGGRIGGAQALLGSILQIKPVVQMKDGRVAEESRQRTRARSIQYLTDKVRADSPLERIAICNGAAEDVDVLLSQLEGLDVAHEPLIVDLGPVVGTHAGPGTMGVCYLVAARPAAASG